MYTRCSIFFDTNAFERRHSGKELFLNSIQAGDLFYDIRSAVEQLGLLDCVRLCIPEIVWREVKQHMLDKFKETIQSFNSKIDEVKKSFGELIDIRYEFAGLDSAKDYPAYLEGIMSEFVHNPKNYVQVVPFPKNEETFNTIINNAVQGVPPFHKAQAKGKEYSDAGLKDVLIWETVKRCDEDELVIFVTNDFDFNKADKHDIRICSSLSEVKNLLLTEMPTTAEALIINRLLDNDAYLIQQIKAECELDMRQSVQVEKITESRVDTDEAERKTLHIVCDTNIDDIKYQFTILYDLNANEFVGVNYKEVA